MEKVIFTNMTVQELETSIIDCVLVCLKGDDRKKQLKKEETPANCNHTFNNGHICMPIFELNDGTEVLVSIFYPLGMAHEEDRFFTDAWDTLKSFFSTYGLPRIGDRFLQDNGGLKVVEMSFGSTTIFIDFLVTT